MKQQGRGFTGILKSGWATFFGNRNQIGDPVRRGPVLASCGLHVVVVIPMATKVARRGREVHGVLHYATLGALTCWTNVMNSFWRFLRDKRNQQVLGWLGGGLIVALLLLSL